MFNATLNRFFLFLAALLLAFLPTVAHAGDIPPRLMEAIRKVECPANEEAAAAAFAREGALGEYQIRPIMVKEVNAILAQQEAMRHAKKEGARFEHKDALNRAKAEQMFIIYQKHWAAKHKDWSAEGMAKRWNGGSRWTPPAPGEKAMRDARKEKKMEEYWVKVKAGMTK